MLEFKSAFLPLSLEEQLSQFRALELPSLGFSPALLPVVSFPLGPQVSFPL